MIRKPKALLAAALAAAALVPAGASPAHAMAACHVRSLGEHSELGQLVVVAGAYKGPATAVDVDLTCGVVWNNGTVARVRERVDAPVAVVGDLVTVYQRGLLTGCHEIKVTYLDGSVSYSDTCP